MLYRKVMVERYQAYLMEKFWTGWGLTRVPKIQGMESIDNAFFLMALQHGVLAPTVFLMIFLYAIASQLKCALRAPREAWEQFWRADPPPGFHDLMALVKRRALRIEGNLHPFMANLLYFKDVMAALRPKAGAQ